MDVFQAKLSAEGMKNLPVCKLDNDFQFIVGHERYPCSWIAADFLSPKICALHSVDPTVTEYVLELSDPDRQFNSFLELWQGSPLSVNDDNVRFFLELSRELQNRELYVSILNHFQGHFTLSEELSSGSVSPFLDFSCESSLRFLASHFSELSVATLSAIPFTTLFTILSQDCLCLSSEDALYEFIASQLVSHPEYFELFRFLEFEYLSRDSIERFVHLSHSHFDFVGTQMWDSICRRLVLSVSPSPPQSKRASRRPESPALSFPFQESAPLNGIIAYLTSKHGGNVHDTGVVRISAKSAMASEPARNVADLADDSSMFQSSYEPDQWICWDFQKRVVCATHYSLAGVKYNNLKSWIIECSMDGTNWTLCDSRSNNFELAGPHRTVNFAMAKPVEARFVRLTQTGPNHNSPANNRLVFTALELFGTLRE
jgi:hypothetical protein